MTKWASTMPERITAEAPTDSSTFQLVLTALNSSKSACSSFHLDKSVFFEKYKYTSNVASNGEGRFTCQVYNKVCRALFHHH